MNGGNNSNRITTAIAFQKRLTIWFSIKQLTGKNSHQISYLCSLMKQNYSNLIAVKFL